MRSKAVLSSSRPPSTACSASIECGGTRSAAICGSSEAAPCGTADICACVSRSFEPAASTRLADHRDGDLDDDVAVRCHLYGEVADRLQRSVRHADHVLLDRQALLLQAVRDVEVRDRAEQTSVDAGLLDDAHVRSGQTLAERARSLEPLV